MVAIYWLGGFELVGRSEAVRAQRNPPDRILRSSPPRDKLLESAGTVKE